MIYLDNAATALKRPDCVKTAVAEALCSLGNAGRGAHEATLHASRNLYSTRKKLNQFFNGESPSQIAFTMNATESLNIAIKGILNPGDHVITTVSEHNSVLRPLYQMEAKGIEITILPCDPKGRIASQDFAKAIRKNTRAIICAHGSNLTGNLIDIKAVGQIAHSHNLLFIVDASQTAGIIPIDVQDLKIHVLCFTGHKSLLGPQGTGGIYVKQGINIRPLKTGGSGIQTYEKNHPPQMPTALEAGTQNGHGIAGLHAAITYLQDTGIHNIRQQELKLMRRFHQGIKDIPGIKLYGDYDTDNRCPIVTLNLADWDSSLVSDQLFTKYHIATRPGAHCAPLMHQALGTIEQGAVRFSFSHYNTEEEIDTAIQAMKQLAEENSIQP